MKLIYWFTLCRPLAVLCTWGTVWWSWSIDLHCADRWQSCVREERSDEADLLIYIVQTVDSLVYLRNGLMKLIYWFTLCRPLTVLCTWGTVWWSWSIDLHYTDRWQSSVPEERSDEADLLIYIVQTVDNLVYVRTVWWSWSIDLHCADRCQSSAGEERSDEADLLIYIVQTVGCLVYVRNTLMKLIYWFTLCRPLTV